MRASDVEVAVLESAGLRVEVVEWGGRVTHLLDRHAGREWLTPVPSTGRPAREGVPFTETDHGGWDEMLPSVEPCRYPGGADAEVPDHGELWSRRWTTEALDTDRLRQSVRSERFGFLFERELSVADATLRVDYELVAETPGPLLWALHPQFAMFPGSRVEVVARDVEMLDTTDPADVHACEWRGDLVVERDVVVGQDRMLYAAPGLAVDAVRLRDPAGPWLSLSWDRTFAPYLGLWLDHGRHSAGRVVAVEPTNGFFDDLSRAASRGAVGVFEAGHPVSWWVEVRVGMEGDE